MEILYENNEIKLEKETRLSWKAHEDWNYDMYTLTNKETKDFKILIFSKNKNEKTGKHISDH